MSSSLTSAQPDFRNVRAISQTGIMPESTLRRLIKRGVIPGFYSGKTFKVNYSLLCELLNSPEWLASISDERV